MPLAEFIRRVLALAWRFGGARVAARVVDYARRNWRHVQTLLAALGLERTVAEIRRILGI
ncbi:MAG: hypothetical protein Q4G34_04830 [Micrococcus sp.]|nr:hypothetical protein [Micrococcus sp.]